MPKKPGVQPPRNYGTIPMETQLWDRPPPGQKILSKREEKTSRKIVPLRFDCSKIMLF